MRACRHTEVPIGGIRGGLIGVIDGAANGHIAGGQIGGRSIALLHSGCMLPSTHWQVQDACDGEPITTAQSKAVQTTATDFSVMIPSRGPGP